MLLKPKPLRPGDTVAVVAPAGAYDVERLARGCALLEGWGLVVRRPRARVDVRYLAGDDEVRAAELRDALADHAVSAVLAARGGFGATRLFERLGLRPVRGTPKVFVGFSDTTVLLTRLVQEAGWVAFHGPMVAADLPDLEPGAQDRFRRFLFDEEGWWLGRAEECWRGGRATGRLVGGCLSMLVASLGTPYEVETDDADVLFLEDVNEKAYRIERMLVQLRDAGKLAHLGAMVIGAMPGCQDEGSPGLLEAIFKDVLGASRYPILFGIHAGHGTENVVLPLGCRVGVDGEARSIRLEESPFAMRP